MSDARAAAHTAGGWCLIASLGGTAESTPAVKGGQTAPSVLRWETHQSEHGMFPRHMNPIAEWRPAYDGTPGHEFGWTFASSGDVTTPALTATNIQTQSRRTRWT